MVNLVTQTPGLSHVAKLMAGMPMERRIPEFAPQTFRQWFGKRGARRHAGADQRVILWADTFNNYFFPETAQAATAILEKAGFEVLVPRQHLCCGRPLYDYGMLDMAKSYLQKIMKALKPQIEAGVPMVVLEPSCASVFRDELHSLFPEDPLAKKLREQTLLLSEFLEKRAPDYPFPRMRGKAIVQGHCHHKSVLRFDAENSVLKKLGLEADVLSAGCCGMAGSFGFESEKYDVSIAVGERKLLPTVRQAPLSTVIMANGFSCREQIAQQTGRRALHLAEVMQLGQDKSDMYPEEELKERRESSRRKARLQAMGALGAVAAGGLLAFTVFKRR